MRVARIQKALSRWGVDALYISNPTDLYYYTGLQLSRGVLFATQRKAIVCVDSRYAEACRKQTPLEVRDLDLKALLAAQREGLRIGFDSEWESYEAFTALKRHAKGKRLVPLQGCVEALRMVKDAEELRKIKTACKLCVDGFDHVRSLLCVGVEECHVAKQLEIFWLERGADGLAFPPIVAFGSNSSMPHYHSGRRKLRRGDAVLVDIGVTVAQYHSDMTRVLSLGKPAQWQRELYALVRQALEAAKAACKPGVRAGEVYDVARQVFVEAGVANQFLHGLGHGVGLKIHEMPSLKAAVTTVLEEGMVLTIEPGLYRPGVGGVRLEDTFVMQRHGVKSLMERCPMEIIELCV